METAAPWKQWKTNRMFPTVPTTLGKLGKRRSSFPKFQQPLRLNIDCRRTKANAFSQRQTKSNGQKAGKKVKTTRPGHTPLAAFQVTTEASASAVSGLKRTLNFAPRDKRSSRPIS